MAQQVRDVMTTTPATVGIDEPIVAAARLMREYDIGDVLVCEGDEIRGIVTDRDIVVRAVADGIDLTSSPVEAVCSSEVVTVSPDTSLDDAARRMRERAVRRLPVVDGKRPVGIVSLGDLAVEGGREQDLAEEALADISAAPANN
jgi:CBS domain-containing protein